MKQIRSAVSLVASLAVLLPSAALAQQIVYHSVLSPTHTDNSYVMARFADQIAEATGNEQSLEIHTGAVLATATAQLTAIADGVIDAGHLIYNYYPSQIPAVLLIADLPGTVAHVSAAAATETMLFDCDECLSEMESVGVQILFNNTTAPQTYMCRNHPIVSLADAQGVQIRAAGSFARLAADIGMAPSPIAWNETYEAIQRGLVDCVNVDFASAHANQFWDIIRYGTTGISSGTSHGVSLIAINGELWESFSPETRRIWLNASADVVTDNVFQAVETSRIAIEEGIREGVQFVEAAADLRDAIIEAQTGQTESAITAAEQRGVQDAEGIATAYARNVEKWTAIYEEIGGDTDWNEEQWQQYRDRLLTEIFDRISDQ